MLAWQKQGTVCPYTHPSPSASLELCMHPTAVSSSGEQRTDYSIETVRSLESITVVHH